MLLVSVPLRGILLFDNEEIVVLLPLLGQKILASEEVVLSEGAIEGFELFLVDAHTAPLCQLAHFALRGEALGGFGQEVYGLGTHHLLASHFKLLDAIEHGQQRGLVEFQEAVLGGLAKEDIGGFDCHFVVLAAMHHDGHLLAQAFLELATAWILTMLGNESVDGFLCQVGKDANVALGFFVAHVEPELVESIGGGALAVEPHVALLGLAKLLAIGLGDEGAGEGIGLVVAAQLATNQLGTGGDVAPLVGTTHLELATLGLVEVQVVVTLEELVGKLGEGHALGKFAIQTALHAVFGHHIVHGDALTDFARKVEEGIVLHPVVVVHQLGSIGGIALEVEKARQLGFDAIDIVTQGFLVEKVALGALARGIANHTRSPPHESEGLVACLLKVAKHHDTAQVTDVQRIGRGVDAHIGRDLLLVKEFFGTGHHLVEHAAPFEFVYKIHIDG